MQFVIDALFNGQVNTDMNAAWLLVFLSMTKDWKAKVVADIDGVISRHRKFPDQKPSAVLGTFSLTERYFDDTWCSCSQE